jgi:hypothetical protein
LLAYLLQQKLNHVSLFAISTFLTYYIYGFFGLIFLSLFSASSILAGIMYWYDLTSDDIKKEFQQALIINKSDDADIQELKKKWINLNESIIVYYEKTKQSISNYDSIINHVKIYYSYLSNHFNSLSIIAYNNLDKFYNLTKDVYGFNVFYSFILFIIIKCNKVYKKINEIKLLHKTSRTIDAEIASMIRNDNHKVNHNEHQNGHQNDQFEHIDKMLANIKPEEMMMMMQFIGNQANNLPKRKLKK